MSGLSTGDLHPIYISPMLGTHNLPAIIAIIAGILIFIRPPLLNYIVAIYLIVIGLLGIFGS
ncbi:MAG: hypothetical protein ACI8UO_005810 [Verrucomicrobiales bacterium]|jgi:hypothetical protein